MVLQFDRYRRSHPVPIRYALSRRVGLRSCLRGPDSPHYLWRMVRNPSRHSSSRRPPQSSPDVLIFSTIVYTAWRSNLYQFRIPSLLRTIVQDATHYFLVIFTSQLLFVFISILGRVRILSYLPVLSFSLAEAFIAFNPTHPRLVSNTRIRLLHLFTMSFSAVQWTICVCLNLSLHLKPSDLNWVSGTFR